MHPVKNNYRLLAIGLAVLPTALFLIGCGDKTPPPSTGGYYDGPMKAKSSTATDNKSTDKTGGVP